MKIYCYLEELTLLLVVNEKHFAELSTVYSFSTLFYDTEIKKYEIMSRNYL